MSDPINTSVQMNVRFTEQLAKDGKLTSNELDKLVQHAAKNLSAEEQSALVDQLDQHPNPVISKSAELVQSALGGTVSPKHESE